MTNGTAAGLRPATRSPALAGRRGRGLHGAARRGRRADRGQQDVLGAGGSGPNVQMNNDSYPPLPQNETAVAYSLRPDDRRRRGQRLRQRRHGRHAHGRRRPALGDRHGVTPCSTADRDCARRRPVGGVQPAETTSSTSPSCCFFRTSPSSEVQIYTSLDNGAHVDAGRRAAIAATNFDYRTGKVNDAVFNDKDYIAVDNTPTSPHYGRVYVTYTKFHMLRTGFSDYCPIKLAYSDTVPSSRPVTGDVAAHRGQPESTRGGNGLGESANQFSVPVVEPNGTLDVAYVLEECNTSLDHAPALPAVDRRRGELPAERRARWTSRATRGSTTRPRPTCFRTRAFRAPNTDRWPTSANTGTLDVRVHEQHQPAGARRHHRQPVHRRRAALVDSPVPVSVGQRIGATRAATTSSSRGSPVDGDGHLPGDLARPPHRPEQPRHHDVPGDVDRRRPHVAPTSGSAPRSWNPILGFFSSGAFIGDYSGIARHSDHRLPGVDRRTATAIARPASAKPTSSRTSNPDKPARPGVAPPAAGPPQGPRLPDPGSHRPAVEAGPEDGVRGR